MKPRGPALLLAFALLIAASLPGQAAPEPRERPHSPLADLRDDADRGQLAAQVELGKRYYVGQDVGQSYESAAVWFGKAAEGGDATAQYYMGEIFRLGQGRAADLAVAAHYYRRAASQRNGNAAARLAYMYVMGIGQPKDYDQAYKWAVIAAVNDNHRAQYRLGLALLGTGKAADVEQGMVWLHSAAQGGDAQAMTALGGCARDGQGMAKDVVEAAMWFTLAVSRGNADASEYLAAVENGLSAEQHTDVKQRVVDWEHANPTPPSPSP